MIKVFLVDDHKMVIQGLQLLLDNNPKIKVIGTAENGEEAIEKIPIAKPDVVLLDINMPKINGIDTCKQLIKEQENLKIIAISMHTETSLIKMMLSAGAKGYVLKNAGQSVLINAINSVYDGKIYLDETVNDIVVNSIANSSKKNKSPFPTISRREKEVLQLILEEFTTQEMADKLCISFGTIETHRRNLLNKLGARNTAGLVKVALEYELHK
ncbi:MAG TPA: response regulator transcription factor [Lutibacter sp.]|nr:response regulator transcription factor [Lutibacter sp.]